VVQALHGVNHQLTADSAPGAPAPPTESPGIEPLDLRPGEYARVRHLEEIYATLDERRRCRGLYFMPEMESYSGRVFRVFKTVEVIKLESTGEVRRLKSPTVFLEGVYCNGERHEGCDRSCFHFWREAWLERADPQEPGIPQSLPLRPA